MVSDTKRSGASVPRWVVSRCSTAGRDASWPRIGAPFRQPQWSALALIESPDTCDAVHESYVAAGAEVITTNTYSLNAVPSRARVVRARRSPVDEAGGIDRARGRRPPSRRARGRLPAAGARLVPPGPVRALRRRARSSTCSCWSRRRSSTCGWRRPSRRSPKPGSSRDVLDTHRQTAPLWISFTLHDELVDDEPPPAIGRVDRRCRACRRAPRRRGGRVQLQPAGGDGAGNRRRGGCRADSRSASTPTRSCSISTLGAANEGFTTSARTSRPRRTWSWRDAGSRPAQRSSVAAAGSAPSTFRRCRPICRTVSLSSPLGRVAEWQTRWLQVPVFERMWGFKSPLAH